MFCCCAAGGEEAKPEEVRVASLMAEEQEPVPLPPDTPANEPEPSEPLPASRPAEPEPAKESVPEEAKPIFECTLERSNGKFGITCDYWAKSIQVVGISSASSSTQAYNANAPEHRRVCKHDFITMVNGERSVEKMKALLQREHVVTLQIAHPERRRLKVVKAEHQGKLWGLKLLYQASTSTCLCVTEVKEGVFRAYNASASSFLRVEAEDFIEEVNGVTESSKQMFEELKDALAVELVLLKLPKGSLTG